MQPTNNAVRRDASPLECSGDFRHRLLVEAGRLLTLAGELVDAYLRDPDDTLECPETVRDEAIIRTAGHVRGRHNYGRIEGRLKAGGAHMGELQPAARSAVRQSGAAALLAPWVLRTA